MIEVALGFLGIGLCAAILSDVPMLTRRAQFILLASGTAFATAGAVLSGIYLIAMALGVVS